MGCQLAYDNGVGRLVAGKHFVWRQFFDEGFIHATVGQFLAHLCFGLAAHQRFGLGNAVGAENLVVFTDGMVGARRQDEIRRHQLRTLVNELKEGVLPVGAGLSPDNGSGVVVHGYPVTGHPLAVAFHICLLQIGGQQTQGVVVRQDGMIAGAEEIAIPDAQQAKDHRHIALEIRVAEMFVHLVGAGQQPAEVVHAHDQGDGQADGGPQRITASHPVPELEHVVPVDTESLHR